MPFVKLGTRSKLPPPGEAREFTHGDRVICVANVKGEYSALDNVCPHRGGPLGQGVIEGEKLICPWHGWEFEARTGTVIHAPSQKVTTYALRLEGDDVMVDL
jgi:nitrite reductase (NADH) small subunit